MPTKQAQLVEAVHATNTHKWKAPSAGSSKIAQSDAAQGKVRL